VIGTSAMLKRFSSGRFGCVGIVSLDAVLGLPDFRGSERVFALLWAAAEAVGSNGRVVIQTLHPEHYAIQAVKDRDRRRFYKHELELRAELGYPPFQRLCVVSVRAPTENDARVRLHECADAVRELADLTVYPPAALGASGISTGRWQFVVKGPETLPRLIAPALTPFLEQRRRGGAVVEVEMDPVS